MSGGDFLPHSYLKLCFYCFGTFEHYSDSLVEGVYNWMRCYFRWIKERQGSVRFDYEQLKV